MKIISRSALVGEMFITVCSRGIFLNTALEKALGIRGKKECRITLAVDDNGHLAMKPGGDDCVVAFRAHRYGNAMMITRTSSICPASKDGKSRRFPVKQEGEWFVSEMDAIL